MSSCNRKKKFVDPAVQGSLARRVVLHWCAFAAVSAVVTLGMHWMANPFVPLSTALSEAWWTYGPVFLVLGCLLPVFVLDTIQLSSRFAGPLHRFQQVLGELADGERPEPVEFRTNDFWRQLADDLNRVSDRLHTQKTIHEAELLTTSAK